MATDTTPESAPHTATAVPTEADDSPELIRRDFARAWGAIGAAWGVTPSTAAVQGYLLLHGGPLTEAELRDALGLSHRAALMALRDCEEWGLILTDGSQAGRPAWSRGASVDAGRRSLGMVPPGGSCPQGTRDGPRPPTAGTLRGASQRAPDPRLRERVASLLEFVHEFDRGVDAVVRADAQALAHLFAVLGRLDDKTLDKLLSVIVAIPEDELIKAATTLSGMSPKLVRGFVALANTPGLARLVGGRG